MLRRLKRFKTDGDFCKRTGRGHKLGLLLYGPPGKLGCLHGCTLSLECEHELAQLVLRRLKRFKTDGDFCKRTGRGLKLGLLLYGPPGKSAWVAPACHMSALQQGWPLGLQARLLRDKICKHCFVLQALRLHY